MNAQLALAWDAAQDGIQRSADHAEAVEPGWAQEAYRLLCQYAADRPYLQFTSEDFRDFLYTAEFPVPVPKALGGVFQRAARAKVIRRAGFAKSRDRHASPIILWEAA